jgi:Mn2+/Fe2+ NRAMP family transporter
MAPMKRFIGIIGPGLLVAATGIGAGDLATASFAGSYLGTTVLWAAVVGAFLKFIVTEGLARWQFATGSTLLEGVVAHLGRTVGWVFLAYLLLWSFFVGSALISACGVTLHALIPLFEDPERGKIVFGIGASLLGLVLALAGGYSLFETVMKVCIVFMLLTVLVTAAVVWPGTSDVLRGLFVPSLPEQGLDWTIALMGGIGGTVTVLCYGYWLREEGRSGAAALRTSRIDLGVAYALTGLFGIAMVIIGSTVEIEGRGAGLLVTLAAQLEAALGPGGKWIFLAGALGAVFSSLLGVWQAVPYLFADLRRMLRDGQDGSPGNRAAVDTRSRAYRGYLFALALVPMAGLFVSFREVQKVYAVAGAWFIPALTLVLLLLNGRSSLVGARFRNRPATVAALLLVLAFFSWIAIRSLT